MARALSFRWRRDRDHRRRRQGVRSGRRRPFLAFPGICPAGVTLVERHEKEKKREDGYRGTRRGRQVSAVVAAGAVAGGVGLLGFGGALWWLAPRLATWQMLAVAVIAWIALSGLAWIVRFRL